MSVPTESAGPHRIVTATLDDAAASVVDKNTDPITAKWLEETLTMVGLVSLELVSAFAADPADGFSKHFVQIFKRPRQPYGV